MRIIAIAMIMIGCEVKEEPWEIKCGAIREDYVVIGDHNRVQERCKGIWMKDLEFVKSDRQYFRCVCK